MDKELLKKDFYEAINGKWIKENDIPKHLTGWGSFYELDENIKNLKIDLLKKWKINSDEIKNESILLEMVKFYKLVGNWDAREKYGIKPALELIKEINQLKSWKDIEKNYKQFSYINRYLPIHFFILNDFKDSKKQILWFDYPEVILPSKNYYTNPAQQGNLLNVWKNMVSKLLNIYFNKDKELVEKHINNAIKFDETLAKFILTPEQEAVFTSLYNMKDIDYVVKKCSFLDFKKIASEIVGGQEVKEICAPALDFLENLDLIYKNNFELFKSRLLIDTLLSAASFLTDECRLLATEYTSALSGIKSFPKDKYEINATMKFYDMPFGMFYGKTYFGEKAKNDVERMVKEMVNIYKNRITKNTWLTPKTIEKAIEKLNGLGIHIGYPTEIRPYYKDFVVLEYEGYNALINNVSKFTYLINEYKFSQYLKPVNKKLWSMSPAKVNAYYSPTENQIVFPAAILQYPFYEYNRNTSENYGGIGAVIAHEISHAFDNNGSNFDVDGNMINWWTEEDKKNFEEKTKQMIELFDNQEIEYGKCNGKLTVSENIADAGGVACAIEAAKKEKDCDLQKFFLSFATIWRIKYREETAKLHLQIDVHAPAKLRTNIQSKNSDDFYKVFDIKEGDNMYLAPEKRVKIW
ncbi:M13 family metallopeptidase [Metamycoplasma hyosynoviae]|uniref:M13 family metallopeptidase n=4 Tax=Metamycoplasma hyosynoviae TaxID=29559 RepID=A0AAP4EKD3_9BACT|nr:M13 family metallopeptidase [Metamycoplasma hyosynoviae]MDC8900603.1 M13 family metallopeptidase [Metamycoplasma hyosynoviae]MDC8911604.1 M13 family metallopeptidase [Metamycoplasma hyosynoviae]MDC8913851.1 M13 family metallopeptidase [Metamycoplasma hyosynoviae]MDC8916332.1 M13 family metallopeptidase [Metamycoplasma hyosynoviae]MDC8917584.1 M13 family metallopeptidase [Metamycoplasma hyosynoviae]